MNIDSLDPPVEVETGENPIASVIWLHGLGADGHDFEPIVPELRLSDDLPLRFVFPQAPHRPVTWNNGFVMRAWYDIAAASGGGFKQNPEHLLEAQDIVRQYITREQARGIEPSRVVLAGFSQGGSVVLHTGLRYSSRLAGVMSLSAPAPFLDKLVAEIDPINAKTPIFLAHGEHDAMVHFSMGQRAREAFTAAGLPLEWHSYMVGHGVCEEEIDDISHWLARVIEVRRP